MAQIIEPTELGDRVMPVTSLAPEELAPNFPQLEIIECLGRGGMGVVYKARQKSLNRFVALKLLAPERAGDPQFAARFEKEAHALAALNHPNIVGVYDFGQAGGFYFLLMEFVDGVNLRQLLQTKRLTPKEALSIVPPVCDALQCAHDHGIVHRDIKPENLLMDKSGMVKIADFGIAKIVTDPTDHRELSHSAQGTPDYAAPEQQNGTADHRADIYSLGVVLYEMLTGERPNENFTPPSKRVQVDIRIDEIVLRALEKTPELRFQTAAAFRTQVEAIEEAPDAVPSEYISSWGFRLTTGPAIKTGTVRFWEKLFGSVESPGAIHSINLSRLGNIGFLALLAILPGMRWCWLAFCFLWMFGLVGVAYLSETAARRGVDLSKTGGLPDAVSQRAVWRNRIFQLIIGGSLLPMVFFVVALTGLLMLGGDKVIEAATTEQMLIVFAKVLGFGTGLALLIWAVMRAFRKKDNQDNPWPRHLEALIAMELLWPLLLIAAPIFLWEFVSATRPLSARMNTEDWILFGVVAAFFLHGAVLVTRNVQRTVREANDPTARREPEPPTHSRWQGWDVWLIALCLVTFGSLWLYRLSEARLYRTGLNASDIVLPSALATVVLLAGAAFLYMLAKNIPTAANTRAESWKRKLGRSVVPTIAVVMLLRTFVVQPFVVPNNSISPEITKGSRILVWKLTSTYAPGDIVAYRHEDKVWVARVTQAGQTTLTLQKNSKLDSVVRLEVVVGKVISVFWRPSLGANTAQTPTPDYEAEALIRSGHESFYQVLARTDGYGGVPEKGGFADIFANIPGSSPSDTEVRPLVRGAKVASITDVEPTYSNHRMVYLGLELTQAEAHRIELHEHRHPFTTVPSSADIATRIVDHNATAFIRSGPVSRYTVSASNTLGRSPVVGGHVDIFTSIPSQNKPADPEVRPLIRGARVTNATDPNPATTIKREITIELELTQAEIDRIKEHEHRGLTFMPLDVHIECSTNGFQWNIKEVGRRKGEISFEYQAPKRTLKPEPWVKARIIFALSLQEATVEFEGSQLGVQKHKVKVQTQGNQLTLSKLEEDDAWVCRITFSKDMRQMLRMEPEVSP
jgi:predicted Ser/Thr protein kinase